MERRGGGGGGGVLLLKHCECFPDLCGLHGGKTDAVVELRCVCVFTVCMCLCVVQPRWKLTESTVSIYRV